MNRRALPLLVAALALAAARAQTAAAYDVYALVVVGRPPEGPSARSAYVGRLAVPAKPGEKVRLENTHAERALRCVVTAKREKGGGVVLRSDVGDGDEPEDYRPGTVLDRDLVAVRDASAGWSGRWRRTSLIAVGVAADAPKPAAEPTANDLLRLLAARLDADAKPPFSYGAILGRCALRAALGDEQAARAERWRARLDAVPDDDVGQSAYLPALLALADGPTVARVLRLSEKDEEDDGSAFIEASDDPRAEGSGMVVVRTPEGPLAARFEAALASAYVQTTDPVVRGTTGWLLYERNPGLYFGLLAEDVAGGRAVLPGDDARRTEREAKLAKALRTREIGAPLTWLAAGVVGTFLLLAAMRLALSRALFR
jgi:hypothetical protein